jgi:hypothetical protein
MKPIYALFLTALLAGASGCDKKSDKSQVAGPVYEKSPITVTAYNDGGTRLRAVNQQGQVILQGLPLGDEYRVYSLNSKGFIVYTTTEGRRRRLHAFNYRGQELNIGSPVISRSSIVRVSDDLVAFTVEQNGTRLYTFTVDGLPVNTSSEELAPDSKVRFIDGLLVFTVISGQRLAATPTGQVIRYVPRNGYGSHGVERR